MRQPRKFLEIIMYWANFLHIYQPAEQQPDILEAVTAQCYRPLLEGLKANPGSKITLNINGALTELFEKHDYTDILDLLRQLGSGGQIEFTSSAKYHAFLPLTDRDEIIRQIKINDETNLRILGDAYNPRGFFPPEMGYTPELAPLIEALGFEWIILDEIACHGEVERVDYTKLHSIEGTSLKVFFRERRISNLIMSAVARTPETLKESIEEDMQSGKYVITAMDGETFGHHRPGLEGLLFDIFSDPAFNLITISEIADHYKEDEPVTPHASTWASSKADLERGVQFLSWSDPDNEIHAWQHELTTLALKKIKELKNAPEKGRSDLDSDRGVREARSKRYSTSTASSPGAKNEDMNQIWTSLREQMDVALASDHYWWASAKPWWSVEMIEDGAYRLLNIIRQAPSTSDEEKQRAALLYENIISTAFDWQRTGKIREMAKQQNEALRIPFKDRTVGADEPWVYKAFTDMMKRLEDEAAERGEYEQAVLWRDASHKLANKLDIYEAMNAINLLRTKIPHDEVEQTIIDYKEEYLRVRGGQPEQRG